MPLPSVAIQACVEVRWHFTSPKTILYAHARKPWVARSEANAEGRDGVLRVFTTNRGPGCRGGTRGIPRDKQLDMSNVARQSLHKPAR